MMVCAAGLKTMSPFARRMLMMTMSNSARIGVSRNACPTSGESSSINTCSKARLNLLPMMESKNSPTAGLVSETAIRCPPIIVGATT